MPRSFAPSQSSRSDELEELEVSPRRMGATHVGWGQSYRCRVGVQVVSVRGAAFSKKGTWEKSNPYVKLQLGSFKGETKTAFGWREAEGEAPVAVFTESFSFDLDRSLEEADLLVKCKDSLAEFGDCCALNCTRRVGMCRIPLKPYLKKLAEADEAGTEAGDLCVPEWFPLYKYSKHTMAESLDKHPVEGEVLLQILVSTATPDHPKCRIFTGTWNIGNAPPPSPEVLASWLLPGKAPEYDLVVVGTQEGQYTPREGYGSCEEDWLRTVSRALNPGEHHVYWLVCSESLGQMTTLVFARWNHFAAISNVASETEATGVAHVGTNKGGVVISFNFWDTSLCFVNSHLAAHQHKSKDRNANYSEIVENCNLGWEESGGGDMLSHFRT